MQVQVVERAQQITLQEQEITRKEKELEARVMKPAEAEKYKLEKLAEAERLAKLWKEIGLCQNDSLRTRCQTSSQRIG